MAARITGKPVKQVTSVSAAKRAAVSKKKGTVAKPAPLDPNSPQGIAKWLGITSVDPTTQLNVLAGADSTYQDTQSSVNRALQDTLADVQRQGTDYDTTMKNDLQSLGWNGQSWNMNDALTQSGRAFSQNAQDFASRGMLGSSGFGTQLTNLGRQFDQQKATADLGAQKYHSDLSAYAGTQRNQAIDALTQAKREAIARRSAKYATSATAALS